MLLHRVLEGRIPLDALLDDQSERPRLGGLAQRDRALVRMIVATALRRRGEIDQAIDRRLDRRLADDTGQLRAILRTGAAQILFLDVPDHAAVSLAVSLTERSTRTRHSKGLVNGVLRRIAREKAEILVHPDPAANTPGWLFDRWRAAYGPEEAEAIARAHLAPPALDVSVRGDPSPVAQTLGGVVLSTGSVRLAQSGHIPDLPDYESGAWWVQDAAAALPAKLLGAIAGRRVADLCAAPGGKTAQLAAAGAAVTAVDLSGNRLQRLAANLSRLGLAAELVAADALAWSPGALFDAILLDAPCTATGTVRRHPDIPWLKRPDDVAALAELQGRLLDRAAALVAPGGLLVFCTCSLEPEEGEAQVAPFLARNSGFRLAPIAAGELAGADHLVARPGWLRTLPSSAFGEAPEAQGMDGFFAVRFHRTG